MSTYESSGRKAHDEAAAQYARDMQTGRSSGVSHDEASGKNAQRQAAAQYAHDQAIARGSSVGEGKGSAQVAHQVIRGGSRGAQASAAPTGSRLSALKITKAPGAFNEWAAKHNALVALIENLQGYNGILVEMTPKRGAISCDPTALAGLGASGFPPGFYAKTIGICEGNTTVNYIFVVQDTT